MKLQEEIRALLMNIYRCLVAHFGPRNWWPAKSSFEVIVGAILAQAVAWRNVEIAITRLEQEGLLSPRAIRELPLEELADYIRSSRYYRMKAKKLKAFMEFFHERYHDSLAELFAQPVDKLRRELLGVYGLGPETVDSILLYAGDLPLFVVDAYTRRVFHRLGFWGPNVTYTEMQRFFQRHLPLDVPLYNDYHAQIVALGHSYCREKPRCGRCPLDEFCQWEGKEEK